MRDFIANPSVWIWLLFLSGGALLSFGNLAGLLPIGLAILMFAAGLRNKISADNPPEVGVVSVWGNLSKVWDPKKPGLRLLAPYFPFFFDVIPISVQRKNRDFPFKNVVTKSYYGDQAETPPASTAGNNVIDVTGGSANSSTSDITKTPEVGPTVTVLVSMTFWADDSLENLHKFIRFGKEGDEGKGGVIDDLYDRMYSKIREAAAAMTWEELVANKNGLTETLCLDLTGYSKVAMAPAENPQSPQPRVSVFEHGIVIGRLTVTNVELDDKEMKEEAAGRTREEFQRRKELANMETFGKLVAKVKADTGADSAEAIKVVQSERKTAQRIFVDGNVPTFPVVNVGGTKP